MLILALICQIKVKTTFSKYNKITPANRMKASEAARLILDMNGLYDVDVVHIPGNLNDHYDHSRKAVCLSDSTFDINSIGAIGVAAHECGHAIQYARGYGPIKLRNNIAPAMQFVSGAWFWVLAVGFLFEWMVAIEIGIVFYSAVVLFQLITLPVEFDASKRAINTVFANQILTGTELDGARKVLNAAAMTYVASFITSVVQLLRLILIARGKRR
ncbi:MAG: zinc metallopeptidase [Ruminiclostridium sp.]|nr:zinc metallopeptidase [Ruminiclostridium sp.]